MATTPKKSVKKASTTKSKVIASPKKRSLSKKQWGIVGGITVLVLAISGYFGIQLYQNLSPNAAGYTTIRSHTDKTVPYFTSVEYSIDACKIKASNGTYTIKARIRVKSVEFPKSYPKHQLNAVINNEGATQAKNAGRSLSKNATGKASLLKAGGVYTVTSSGNKSDVYFYVRGRLQLDNGNTTGLDLPGFTSIKKITNC